MHASYHAQVSWNKGGAHTNLHGPVLVSGLDVLWPVAQQKVSVLWHRMPSGRCREHLAFTCISRRFQGAVVPLQAHPSLPAGNMHLSPGSAGLPIQMRAAMMMQAEHRSASVTPHRVRETSWQALAHQRHTSGQWAWPKTQLSIASSRIALGTSPTGTCSWTPVTGHVRKP